MGGFQFGKKSGLGTFYKVDGETIPGCWRQDQLVSEVNVFFKKIFNNNIDCFFVKFDFETIKFDRMLRISSYNF